MILRNGKQRVLANEICIPRNMRNEQPCNKHGTWRSSHLSLVVYRRLLQRISTISTSMYGCRDHGVLNAMLGILPHRHLMYKMDTRPTVLQTHDQFGIHTIRTEFGMLLFDNDFFNDSTTDGQQFSRGRESNKTRGTTTILVSARGQMSS